MDLPTGHLNKGLISSRCGSNSFQGYFDDAKESRVKQKFQAKIQESSFKNQDSRFKNQDSRIIKIKIQDSRFRNQGKTQSR